MRRRGGRTADQKRDVDLLALHLGCHENHFVERGRDQTGQADDVGAFLARGLQDGFARHHHAKVNDFIAITLKHHADDVLSDVVDIAFHGRQHDFSVGRPDFSGGFLLGFHERNEVGHGLFHHPGRLHHLGQKHLAIAEQVPDDIHAVHQGTLDDMKRPVKGLPRLLGILDDELVDTMHQRMPDAFGHRRFAPFQIACLGRSTGLAPVSFGDLQQTVSRIVPAIEDDILDAFTQFRLDIVIDIQLAGIDDPHVHAGLDRMEQEDRVHGPADGFIAAEGEGDVRKSAGDVTSRQVLADATGRFDEVDRVVVVFLDACSDGEDIGVKDDVFRRKADLVDQNTIGALADLELAIRRVRLTGFVKSHHHDGGAIGQAGFRLRAKLVLALLQADRIDDRLALDILQPGLDHLPFGAVDHDRHTGNVRLSCDQAQEAGHGLNAVQQPLIHVHIDDLGPVLHLLAGNRNSLGIVAFGDQLPEAGRAGDIRALADIDEAGYGN